MSVGGVPDPASVDRSDPEAVIRAWVTTANSWDSGIDKTSAYATVRAEVFLTDAQRQAQQGYDPDTAKGQGEFTKAASHDGYATVVIRQVSSEGLDPDRDGQVHRIVHYLVKVIGRDESGYATTTAWDAWVTAKQEHNRWAIAAAHAQPSQS